MNRPSASPCEGSHLKVHRNTALKFHVHDLMIHHVIVTGIHTASVRPLFQCLINPLFRQVTRRHHTDRPCLVTGSLILDHFPDTGPFIGHIDFFCVIRTTLFCPAALKAALRRSLGRHFRPEQIQPAVRRDPFTLPSKEPYKNITVMAAFGQNHRACLLLTPPVASDKTVGLVPVGHLFHGLHRHHLTDSSRINQFLHLCIKRCIPKHMPHCHNPVIRMRRLLKPHTLLKRRRDGFFTDHMVPQLNCLHGLGHMLSVLGGNHKHIRKLRLL